MFWRANHSGGLSFSFQAAIRSAVVIAEVICQAERFSSDAFLAQTTKLVLESDAAACELELDEPLSDQEPMNGR